MRVLHCPTDIGGNSWYLSRAERELGIKSDVMVMEGSQYHFPGDMILSRAGRTPRLIKELRRWLFLIKSINQYDIFHFNGGQSFFTYPRIGIFYLDLPLIRSFNKKIIISFNGCDIRFPSQCGACATASTPCRSDRTERLRHRRSKLAEKHADYLFVSTPDLKQSLPMAEWRPQSRFFVEELAPIDSIYKDLNPIPFRIVHAPTRRIKKGTEQIERVINELSQEGVNIELNLIEGLTHSNAIEIMKRSHLVIDQLLIGWYGGVSVEGMALAKPVICNIDPEFYKFIPSQVKMQMPIVSSTSLELRDRILELLNHPAKCLSLGRKGREYVKAWHDPRKIAARTVEIYHTLFETK
jgi:glycosyltransferase involved in cell wall biosynthesis